jgi:hypothetical protein
VEVCRGRRTSESLAAAVSDASRTRVKIPKPTRKLLSTIFPLTMKRKLNDQDIPTPVEEANAEAHGFEGFSLDSRLLQAIAREGFTKPTPIQSTAIPLALGGKDILGARMRAIGSPNGS